MFAECDERDERVSSTVCLRIYSTVCLLIYSTAETS